jgi:agmatinase
MSHERPQWNVRRSLEGDVKREPGPLNLNRYEFERQNQNPVQTFLKLPLALTPEDLRAGRVDVAICGVPFEMVISAGGMSYGPQAIRTADYLPVPPLNKPHLGVRVDPFDVLRVVDYGDAPVTPYDIQACHESIRGFIKEIAGEGVIPLVLGGDHSITWPVASGLAEIYGPGNVGVVHLDAHADTASDAFGCPVSQGSPIRRLIEDGHLKGRNFVQVGLRGYWPGSDELKWMSEQGIKTHFMAAIDRYGFGAVMDKAIEQALDGPEHLYVSVDIDVLDPSYAPGTGGIEPGGLTTRELLPMIRRIAHEVGICGLDVVEVSPMLDNPNRITAIAAHRVILEALTGIAMRRSGVEGQDYLHPDTLGNGQYEE